MNITNDHFIGFAVGMGACAIGFHYYLKNQGQVNEFLAKQGINLPACNTKDYSVMTLEELVTEKEKLEDLIAERQIEQKV